jgi:hypothetical protein
LSRPGETRRRARMFARFRARRGRVSDVRGLEAALSGVRRAVAR